ncbi:MAG: hypothetical protein JSR89_16540 [Proteobacteria bacterium]|nr:hypothetical protein [Pseudomonadota bacterium]
MMRTRPELLRALSSLAALTVIVLPGIATAETCTGFQWSVDTELGWAAAPEAQAVQTEGKIVSIPNKAIDVALQPAPTVKLPAASDIKKQAIPKDSFSGWFSIGGIAKAGLYQITISNHAWIDVVQNNELVQSTAFSGDKNCKTLRKSVQYELSEGPAIVQISGSPDKTMRLTIREAVKK